MLSESKIRIMKAIHNLTLVAAIILAVVLSESKIRIMKAIHNPTRSVSTVAPVVLSESKIRIMKAIHNLGMFQDLRSRLCSVSQR